MPEPEQILSDLTRVANDGIAVALAWHVLLAVAGLAVVAGWRPSRRTAAALLAVPLASVSATAWVFHNPFNGLVMGTAAATLLLIAWRNGDREPVAAGPRWSQVAGGGLVLFGWVYPHFLVNRPAAAYLVAAPVGLVPCPTLSIVVGCTLLAGGLGPRAWTWTLAITGAFYGLFGLVRLGVWIDGVLLAGTACLLFLPVGGLLREDDSTRWEPWRK